jgi:predicted nucleic acid-binding protein
LIFVDSNIPMYLVGAEHPHKPVARSLLESAVARQVPLVTDAEVFQEILHRYHAIKRPDAIQPAFDVLLRVVDEVLPIDLPVVQRAKEIMATDEVLSARDAVHVAVMEAHRITQILSFDAGFDRRRDIQRVT